MKIKPLHISTVAFLAGASAVLGGGALTTGSLNLSGSQSFEGGTLVTGGSVVENNPVLEGGSELSDGVATVACEGLVLTGEGSFDGETVVTGGEIIEIDNGQVDAEGKDEPQIVICEPMMPPPTVEAPDGEVDETGGEIADGENVQDETSDVTSEVATPTLLSGSPLVLKGENSFDGEVVVTGGRIAENQRSVDSLGTPEPVYSAGVINLKDDKKLSLAGASSFSGDTVVTGGKLIKNEPTAENAVEEVTVINSESSVTGNKELSSSDKIKQSKNINATEDAVSGEVSNSAQSAVLKGGRVFLR